MLINLYKVVIVLQFKFKLLKLSKFKNFNKFNNQKKKLKLILKKIQKKLKIIIN